MSTFVLLPVESNHSWKKTKNQEIMLKNKDTLRNPCSAFIRECSLAGVLSACLTTHRKYNQHKTKVNLFIEMVK